MILFDENTQILGTLSEELQFLGEEVLRTDLGEPGPVSALTEEGMHRPPNPHAPLHKARTHPTTSSERLHDRIDAHKYKRRHRKALRYHRFKNMILARRARRERRRANMRVVHHNQHLVRVAFHP